MKEEGLEEGRKAVSMIVGRDTERLDEKGVVKAAVETDCRELLRWCSSTYVLYDAGGDTGRIFL